MNDNKSKQIEITDESFIPCSYNKRLGKVYILAKDIESVTVTKEYYSRDIKDVPKAMIFFNSSSDFISLDDIKYLEPILKYLDKKKSLHSEKDDF